MTNTPDFLKAPPPAHKQFVQTLKKNYAAIRALLSPAAWQLVQLAIFIAAFMCGLEWAVLTWDC